MVVFYVNDGGEIEATNGHRLEGSGQQGHVGRQMPTVKEISQRLTVRLDLDVLRLKNLLLALHR
jgi:hypothetical protein